MIEAAGGGRAARRSAGEAAHDASLARQSRRGDAPLHRQPSAYRHDACRDRRRGSYRRGWRARDTDWWIDQLYDFAADLGATMVHTAISRTSSTSTAIPSGASLYPGQATTGLCPTETFDGEPLYRDGEEPGRGRDRAAGAQLSSSPIMRRWQAEIARLRASMAASCSMTATRSARSSRACSRARCRSSTSAPMTARAATPALAGGDRATIMRGSGRSLRRQRPLQGRLDHAPLRPARRRRARAPDGAVACRGYHARAEGAGRRRTTGRRLRPGLRRADARRR